MIITPSKDKPEGSSSYRLKRGTRASEIPSPDPVPSLSAFDGPFQLAEYLALKVRHDPHDVRGLVEVPSGDGTHGGKGPDKDVWIYEHLRRIPIDLSPLITSLLPTCSRQTCPQMKADEWLYLCTAHGGPGTEDCCAIDYILHTLDLTTALVNSTKNFPSRMQIPPASLSHFPSLFRRLSRIFAHAYYHHRESFSLAEAETSLYARFVGLCERYELVGENLLVIPRSAVGQWAAEDSSSSEESEEEDEGDGDVHVVDDLRGATRGRETQGEGKERRTHSLDRHPLPNMKNIQPPSLPPKEGIEPTVGTTSHPMAKNKPEREMTVQKVGERQKTFGRGTLGRGKQSRGTMLWTSDEPVFPEEPSAGRATNTAAGTGMTRSESLESVVHIEAEEVPVSSTIAASSVEMPAEARENEGVPAPVAAPKDEIEPFEEEGVLPPGLDVSPLPAPANTQETRTTAEVKVALDPAASEPKPALGAFAPVEGVREGGVGEAAMEDVKLVDELAASSTATPPEPSTISASSETAPTTTSTEPLPTAAAQSDAGSTPEADLSTPQTSELNSDSGAGSVAGPGPTPETYPKSVEPVLPSARGKGGLSPGRSNKFKGKKGPGKSSSLPSDTAASAGAGTGAGTPIKSTTSAKSGTPAKSGKPAKSGTPAKPVVTTETVLPSTSSAISSSTADSGGRSGTEAELATEAGKGVEE